MEMGEMGTIRLHRVTSKNSDYIFEELFIHIYFFPLLLCVSRENRIKLKKILRLNHRLKWNTNLQICKLHLIFLSTLALRDQSIQMESKQKRTWEGI